MPLNCIPPYTPLLYSKTGVCRGIPIFVIFDPKHGLWLEQLRRGSSKVYPQSVLNKNKKNIKLFLMKFSLFFSEKKKKKKKKKKKNLTISVWAGFRNVLILCTILPLYQLHVKDLAVQL